MTDKLPHQLYDTVFLIKLLLLVVVVVVVVVFMYILLWNAYNISIFFQEIFHKNSIRISKVNIYFIFIKY